MYVLAYNLGKAHTLYSLSSSWCGQSMWEYSGCKNHVSNKQAKSLYTISDTMSNRNRGTVLLLTVNLRSRPETKNRFLSNTMFSLLILKIFSI